MKIINQSYEILTPLEQIQSIPKMIEVAGRTCYKSEDKITEDSAFKFCERLIKRGHEAMIEHGNISVRFITNRGVTHELVRHRLSSFAQESTRYVKYDGDMEFIKPVFKWAQCDIYKELEEAPFSLSLSEFSALATWYTACLEAEDYYKCMIKSDCSPQEAREVLPNSLKTEIIVTANIREWRHIFKFRCSKSAHPQIRELLLPLLNQLHNLVPCLFSDIYGEISK